MRSLGAAKTDAHLPVVQSMRDVAVRNLSLAAARMVLHLPLESSLRAVRMKFLLYQERCVAILKTEALAPTSQLSGSLTWIMVAVLTSGMVDVKEILTNLIHRKSASLLVLNLREWGLIHSSWTYLFSGCYQATPPAP
nr:uncharacterized protein LOC128688249 isoform X1 [Cherax quadricarinatus]